MVTAVLGGRVSRICCGSLFTGYCNADGLVEDFVKQLGLDSGYLLYFGVDGPNVTLSFKNMLTQHLSDRYFHLEIKILLSTVCALTLSKGNKRTISGDN